MSCATPTPPGKWHPGPFLWLQLALHGAALLLLMVYPYRWPWAVATVVLSQLMLMAAGLWLTTVALFRVTEQPIDRMEAGAALLVIFWSCVGVRMGIRFDKGPRHIAANMLCAGVILAVYNAIATIFG